MLFRSSLIDLDSKFKAKLGTNLVILNGSSEDIFDKLLSSDLLNISEIFTDYSNKPDDVKNENSLKRILAKNTSVKLHLISKVNSLTNIEEIVNQENFKPPKTMKDMEKLNKSGKDYEKKEIQFKVLMNELVFTYKVHIMVNYINMNFFKEKNNVIEGETYNLNINSLEGGGSSRRRLPPPPRRRVRSAEEDESKGEVTEAQQPTSSFSNILQYFFRGNNKSQGNKSI